MTDPGNQSPLRVLDDVAIDVRDIKAVLAEHSQLLQFQSTAPGGGASAPAQAPALTWKWFGAMVASFAAVALVIGILILMVSQAGPFGYKPNANTWSAVLLSDNEVFFGHVKEVTGDRVTLTKVYYVQKPASGSSSSNAAPSILSFVGTQIQCPKDEISINRSQVLYWEDLQDSSYVVKNLNTLSTTNPPCFTPPSGSAAPAPSGAATPAATP